MLTTHCPGDELARYEGFLLKAVGNFTARWFPSIDSINNVSINLPDLTEQ